MSYQVLARKYRPKSFDTLVGQEHVVRALSHALEQQRLHHAYLFTGTRGVGKTTLSRILAKSFNCEKGITSQPCGVCDACTSIDAGRFVDYIEMDAASNRGVDEMAALLEQAIYAPSNARFKVYMIDEVHMLTNHAFNSMLKTLEEPPAHVKFILATTDPQKIPVTVLSRCLQFNLKQMPPGHIVAHLENILGQEHIDFELPALRLLAQGAHGSMRDALSLTDQAIAYAAGKVSLDAVQNMLGALDQSYLIRLLDALAQEDGAGLLAVADEMAARSLSYKSALQDLGTMLHQIAVAQMVPAALAEELPERAELLRLAQRFNKEEIQLFYQIVVHGRNEIGLAPDEYAGFSMTLLRMLAFRPASLGATASLSGGGKSPSRALASISAPTVAPTIARVAAPAATALASAPAPVQTALATPQVGRVEHVEHVENSASATTISAVPAKPVSPAMAALAAARAASGQKQSGLSAQRAAAPPVQTTTLAPTSNSQAAPAASPTGNSVPVPVAAIVPTRPEPQPSRNIISDSPKSATVESMPAYRDSPEMPPPWDDVAFDEQLAAPPTSRHKEIQEADYWSDELVAKPPVMPSVATHQIAESPNVAVHGNDDVNDKEGADLAVSVPVLADVSVVNDAESLVPTSLDAERKLVANAVVSDVANRSQPLKLMPMPEIAWDGHWPNLAASLPVRGVAQQLAQQSELRLCAVNGNAIQFKLCVPLQTLLSAGSGEKLTLALNERFAEFGKEIRVDFEIGAVEQTANAQAVAERAERLVQAEQAIQSDSFVQTLMREFGASILTGSVRPI